MLGLPDSLGIVAAISQRSLCNGVRMCETLTLAENLGRKRWRLRWPCMLRPVVGLGAVRSYLNAKDSHPVRTDKSLQYLEKELLLSKGSSMRQQTFTEMYK